MHLAGFKTEKPFLEKTFKTFTNFVWIETIYVKRRNITIKINIWIAFRNKKKISFTVKTLYDIDSRFTPGFILVFSGNYSFKEATKSCCALNRIALFLCGHYFV